MKPSTWRITSIVTLTCMVGLVLVAVLRGGCSDVIETTAGAGVPMRCHWCFKAMTAVGCMGAVNSILALAAKGAEGRRMTAIATLVTCIVLIAIPTPVVIGICQGADTHHCHASAYIAWIISAIALITCLVQVMQSDPDKHRMRKHL